MNSLKAIGLKEEGLFRSAQVLMNYYLSPIYVQQMGSCAACLFQKKLAGVLRQASTTCRPNSALSPFPQLAEGPHSPCIPSRRGSPKTHRAHLSKWSFGV